MGRRIHPGEQGYVHADDIRDAIGRDSERGDGLDADVSIY